jgi:hypothetical protein
LRLEDGSLTGATLSSPIGGFDALAVGDVLALRSGPGDSGAHAIASIIDDHTVELATRPTHLAAASALTVIARTFRAQAAPVHERLLRSIGLDPDDPTHGLGASAVVSTNLMRHLEALGTLAELYAAAAADAPGFARRAEVYRRRFHDALLSAPVLIDTDGDGQPDVRRMPSVSRLVRV